MADLAIQRPGLTGAALAFVAAGGAGDIFTNGGDALLDVKNGSGAPINVTVDSKVPCNHGFDHDVVVSVPAAGERLIGPFPTSRFNDPITGKASVTYSAVASVTVAVVQP